MTALLWAIGIVCNFLTVVILAPPHSPLKPGVQYLFVATLLGSVWFWLWLFGVGA